MSNDWEKLQAARGDMSQYVMHCTKSGVNPATGLYSQAFHVLLSILSDGYLRAGFSRKRGVRKFAKVKPLIRGPYPAVCFTEQPLRFFIETLRIRMVIDRYS